AQKHVSARAILSQIADSGSKTGLANPLALVIPSRLFLSRPLALAAPPASGWPFVMPLKPIFMSVKIRMKRIGAKNTPAFRIVVADSRSPRDGKCIEELGTYLPEKRGDNFTLKLDRADYWLSKGAQPSETVASFIKKAKKAATATA